MQPNKPLTHVYLLRVDSSVNNTVLANTPVVPLQILENELDSNLLISLLQNKTEPLQLLVDASKQNKDATKNPLDSEIPQSTDVHNLVNPITLNITEHSVLNNQAINNLRKFDLQQSIHEYYNINETITLSDSLAQSSNTTLNPESPRQQTYKFPEQNEYLSKEVEYIVQNTTHKQTVPFPSESMKLKKNKSCPKNSNETDQKMKNYIHISDAKVPPRAIATLPSALQIRGNFNVWARKTLPARIRFGPVVGIEKNITQYEANFLVQKNDSPVFLLKQKNGDVIHIDVSDRDKSNWLSLLPLGDQKTANVWLYEEGNKLFAIATEPIDPRVNIKLGYSKKYAEDHKIPPGPPVMDLESVLSANPKRWWCNECHRALPSATLLQRHFDVYHKDDMISTRRGYRCRHCRRTFSRMYTLRRHATEYCLKRTEKKPDKITEEKPPDINNTNSEDRIPSDESFQNFSNGLEFSTNLFDTDRISNLDLSVNSRTDAEFNPYSIGFKDDIAWGNDLSLSKPGNPQINKQISEDPILDSCTYCGQVVSKENRRKHVSGCPSRRLECSCGRLFTNKKRLAQHIRTVHRSEPPETNEKKTAAEVDIKKPYKCEQCDSCFKRRGMLVNHLWRVHKTVSTAPVVRPVRHYPCVACPKIYRSASKRDRHVKVHHPGVEKVRGAGGCIEGGVRSCVAASCDACPRQYATRAKLLQHIRAEHPALAASVKKSSKLKTDVNEKEALGDVGDQNNKTKSLKLYGFY